MKPGLTELTKQSALEFERTFENLFNSGSFKEMAAYYSEDAELIRMKFPVYKGCEAIERFWKKTIDGSRKVKIKRTIEMLNVRAENNLGYISGIVRVEIKVVFLKIKKVFRYVTVWKKEKELWQLAIDISTQIKTTNR